MTEGTILGSIVIREGRISDYRQLVNVACAVAKRKEGTSEDVSIKEIVWFPRTRVYVALYEIPASSRRMKSQRRSERECETMV